MRSADEDLLAPGGFTNAHAAHTCAAVVLSRWASDARSVLHVQALVRANGPCACTALVRGVTVEGLAGVCNEA